MLVFLLLVLLASAGPMAPNLEPARLRMVERDLEPRGIEDTRVLEVMRSVPREAFVPAALRLDAYADRSLPIGPQATISAPYIVALMTQLAQVQPGDRVLEVGTGSGYQAAVLHSLGARVWTIELDPVLAEDAAAALAATGHGEVVSITGDGYAGHPDAGPYDIILVTAAPPEIPKALLRQLADGGRMIAPVGTTEQRLTVIRRRGDRYEQRTVASVRFVPMRRP